MCKVKYHHLRFRVLSEISVLEISLAWICHPANKISETLAYYPKSQVMGTSVALSKVPYKWLTKVSCPAEASQRG